MHMKHAVHTCMYEHPVLDIEQAAALITAHQCLQRNRTHRSTQEELELSHVGRYVAE